MLVSTSNKMCNIGIKKTKKQNKTTKKSWKKTKPKQTTSKDFNPKVLDKLQQGQLTPLFSLWWSFKDQ